MRSFIVFATLALASLGSAQAAGIGIRAGTTGVGADVGWGVAPTLAARVGYSTLNWNTHLSETSVRYDAKLKLSNLNAFLDWSPIGPFRITGGAIANNNKYELTGSPPGGTFNGAVKSGRSIAPYLGVGYGNVSGLGVNFYFDLGVMFMGSPKANINATCTTASGPACTALQNQAAQEARDLETELRRFKYYPVANIGLTIGF
jgi:hypothetical protein